MIAIVLKLLRKLTSNNHKKYLVIFRFKNFKIQEFYVYFKSGILLTRANIDFFEQDLH